MSSNLTGQAEVGFRFHHLDDDTVWDWRSFEELPTPWILEEVISPYPGLFPLLGTARPTTGYLEYPQPFRPSMASHQGAAIIVTGWLYFPQDGAYRFRLQARGNAQLWIVPANQRALPNPQPIIRNRSNDPDSWDESEPMEVRAGDAAALALVLKNPAEDGFFRVAWRLNDGPPSIVPIGLLNWGGHGKHGWKLYDRMRHMPRDLTVLEGAQARFFLQLEYKDPVQIAWTRNGQWLGDQTSPLLEFQARPEDHGVQFRATADFHSSLPATLHVWSRVRDGITNLFLNDRFQISREIGHACSIIDNLGWSGGSWLTQGDFHIVEAEEHDSGFRFGRFGANSGGATLTQGLTEVLQAGVPYEVRFDARRTPGTIVPGQVAVDVYSTFEQREWRFTVEDESWNEFRFAFTPASTEPTYVRWSTRSGSRIDLSQFVLTPLLQDYESPTAILRGEPGVSEGGDGDWSYVQVPVDVSGQLQLDQTRSLNHAHVHKPVEGISAWSFHGELTSGFMAYNTQPYILPWARHDIPARALIAGPGQQGDAVGIQFRASQSGMYRVIPVLLPIQPTGTDPGLRWFLVSNGELHGAGVVRSVESFRPPLEPDPVRLKAGDFVQFLVAADLSIEGARAIAMDMTVSDVESSVTSPRLRQIGYLKELIFHHPSGSGLLGLMDDPRFPDAPDSSRVLSSFSGGTPEAGDHGRVVVGFLLPPTTGVYRLHLEADGEAALFLGTDNRASSRKLVAMATPSTPARPRRGVSPAEEVTFHPDSAGISEPIDLVAGMHYYVELRQRTGHQDGRFRVGWVLDRATGDHDPSTPLSGAGIAAALDSLDEPLGAEPPR
jgi:hypothetical protein